MRERSFYHEGIVFESTEDQQSFEDVALLDPTLWKVESGAAIGRGTFRVVRESKLVHRSTKETKLVVQKSLYHPLGSKKLSLLEAYRWWELRKRNISLMDFTAVHMQSLDLFCDDLRQGYGAYPGASMVFDTNASREQQRQIASYVKKRPIGNREEFLHHLQSIVASLTTDQVDLSTDEVFLLVLHERQAILQVVLGDLKMLELRSKPTGNQQSLRSLLKFLEKLGILAH
jgi:hypothetical protein